MGTKNKIGICDVCKENEEASWKEEKKVYFLGGLWRCGDCAYEYEDVSEVRD